MVDTDADRLLVAADAVHGLGIEDSGDQAARFDVQIVAGEQVHR